MKIQINNIYNGDNLDLMKYINDKSIDVILTDPPYLYLKNQKLDREFDEYFFFKEADRVLKDEGFILLFGRGSSFYRWNTILSNLGYKFLEEIVWDKRLSSSPYLPINRVHETISIHSKGQGKIKKRMIPYIEKRAYDFENLFNDIKRIDNDLRNSINSKLIKDYLENNIIQRTECDGDSHFGITGELKYRKKNVYQRIQNIQKGFKESSIIPLMREHYKTIHPTQKPPRLLERLLALVSNEGDLILDPFAGSCNTAKACINTNRKYICMEIDNEFYSNGIENIKTYTKNDSNYY